MTNAMVVKHASHPLTEADSDEILESIIVFHVVSSESIEHFFLIILKVYLLTIC